MAEIRAHIPSLMHRMTMTVRVTGQREMSARLWLATRLIRFGCRVMGCRCEVEIG